MLSIRKTRATANQVVCMPRIVDASESEITKGKKTFNQREREGEGEGSRKPRPDYLIELRAGTFVSSRNETRSCMFTITKFPLSGYSGSILPTREEAAAIKISLRATLISAVPSIDERCSRARGYRELAAPSSPRVFSRVNLCESYLDSLHSYVSVVAAKLQQSARARAQGTRLTNRGGIALNICSPVKHCSLCYREMARINCLLIEVANRNGGIRRINEILGAQRANFARARASITPVPVIHCAGSAYNYRRAGGRYGYVMNTRQLTSSDMSTRARARARTLGH